MNRELLKYQSVRIAGVALLACTAVALYTVVSAVRITPSPRMEPPVFLTDDATAARPRVPDISVAKVVNANVFAPERSAPPQRYLLAGGFEAYQDAVDDVVPEPPARPVVHGTVVGTNGRSFAMCALNGAPSVIVRVGDRLGDYTVRSIERGVVEFSTASGERFAIDATSS